MCQETSQVSNERAKKLAFHTVSGNKAGTVSNKRAKKRQKKGGKRGNIKVCALPPLWDGSLPGKMHHTILEIHAALRIIYRGGGGIPSACGQPGLLSRKCSKI